ncbi:MAG: hypothetical protein HLUCCX10_03265 [Algoriphagus marincola HL-49]|uniref:Uncharacterized protein n=1 Tax=Algoriphagus marincola HL-49 TaxID=1305737 RepID=A0A0P7YU66_9BACT|nr:MAG: hypothetical protein HLUCCX10_03265 [Algoriphagus marincola HL-49]
MDKLAKKELSGKRSKQVDITQKIIRMELKRIEFGIGETGSYSLKSMKKLLIISSASAILATGCTSSSNKDTTGEQAGESITKTETATDRIINFPKVEVPFDEGSAQRCVFTINEIDAYAMVSARKDTLMNLGDEGETPISIWYDESARPIKIEQAVKGDSGQISGVFRYYFINGKLWLADWLFAKYLFDEDEQLAYWLGETWSISETKDSANFDERQKQVTEPLKTILKNLNLK